MKTKVTILEPEQKHSTTEQNFDATLKELATDLNTDISNILRIISILKPERILDMNGQFLPEVRSAIENELNAPIDPLEAPEGFIPRQERRTLQSTPLSAKGLFSLHLALNYFKDGINNFAWMNIMIKVLAVYIKNADHKDVLTKTRIELISDTMELFRMLGEVVTIDDVDEWTDYPEFIEQV